MASKMAVLGDDCVGLAEQWTQTEPSFMPHMASSPVLDDDSLALMISAVDCFGPWNSAHSVQGTAPYTSMPTAD